MADQSKVAVVTGGGTGIGRAVALKFAANGYRVALTGRRLEPMKETRELAGKTIDTMIVHVTDVTDRLSVKASFQEVNQSFGRIDVLFNNAGISAPAVPIDELKFDDWKKVIDTNLTGTFLCCQEAFRAMKSQDPRGGRIINNGSVSAQTPRPLSAPYTASKHAITGLTRALALDGREFDIACSQIDIGNAATDFTKPMAKGILQPDGTTMVEDRMDVEHAATAVLMMAELPLDTNVLSMTIKATKMPLEGRG